jgi:hypothetical protein
MRDLSATFENEAVATVENEAEGPVEFRTVEIR